MAEDQPDPTQKPPEHWQAIMDAQKQIATLSTGSIVLLATFLNDLFKKPEWKALLGVTFTVLLIALIAAVWVIAWAPFLLRDYLEGGTTYEGVNRAMTIAVVSAYVISLTSFYVGIASFAIFSMKNFF
jgi:cation transport ATPase